MALSLAQGRRFALAQWYLGALYPCLHKCSKNFVWSAGQCDVVSYVEANFLQLFLWERFGAFSSIPFEFKPAKTRIVDKVEKVKVIPLEG